MKFKNILFFCFLLLYFVGFSQPYRLPVDYQEAERFVKKHLIELNNDFVDGFTYYFYDFDYFWFLSNQDTTYCVTIVMPNQLKIFSMDCGSKDIYYDDTPTNKIKDPSRTAALWWSS